MIARTTNRNVVTSTMLSESSVGLSNETTIFLSHRIPIDVSLPVQIIITDVHPRGRRATTTIHSQSLGIGGVQFWSRVAEFYVGPRFKESAQNE